jgi:hypothetical protein
MAKAMQPMMRYMMDGLMHVTDHYNDATYKEVRAPARPPLVRHR